MREGRLKPFRVLSRGDSQITIHVADSQFPKLAIHLAYFTYDAIFAGCSSKIRSANQRKLIPIHLAYIMLFSYFCTACENSEICFYIFSHSSFDFYVRTAPCANLTQYANLKMRHVKNLQKQTYILLLFHIITLCDTWKCVSLAKYIGGLGVLSHSNSQFLKNYVWFAYDSCSQFTNNEVGRYILKSRRWFTC